MFTVALVGPDGSGKTTISERILKESSVSVKRIYMGINRSESNVALPTTKLLDWIDKLRGRNRKAGPKNPESERSKLPKNPILRAFKEVKSAVLLANRLLDEAYRYLVTWFWLKRGNLVIFDRHFYLDYYHYDIQTVNQRWTNRLHGHFLEHVFPKPDVVIYLDAPAELLFARKGEGSIELLETRRQNYLSLKNAFHNFYVVDASQPVDKVFSDVQAILAARLQGQSHD
jgi:thymidylate kinase